MRRCCLCPCALRRRGQRKRCAHWRAHSHGAHHGQAAYFRAEHLQREPRLWPQQDRVPDYGGRQQKPEP
eukprot:27570_4